MLFGFGGGGSCSGLVSALALLFPRIGDGLLLAASQRNHTRVFRVLRGFTGSGLDWFPLLAMVIVFGAVQRSLGFAQGVCGVLVSFRGLRQTHGITRLKQSKWNFMMIVLYIFHQRLHAPGGLG